MTVSATVWAAGFSPQQREHGLGVGLDVLAEPPGHAPKARYPSRPSGAARPRAPPARRHGMCSRVVALEPQAPLDLALAPRGAALGRREAPLAQPRQRGHPAPVGAGRAEHRRERTPLPRGRQGAQGTARCAATAAGASSCTAWPAPGTTTRRRERAPSARRSRGTSRRARRPPASPASRARPSRSHSGGITPVPSPRSARRGRRRVLRRRSACAAAATSARLAGEQRLRRPLARERLDADRLDPVGERLVGRAAAPRARPRRRGRGSPPTSTSRSTRAGMPQRERQREPAAHRVAAEREPLGASARTSPRGGRSVPAARHARRGRGGRARARGSVPPASRTTAVPARAGLREAVEEDEVARAPDARDDASHRHLPRPARLRRRARALRPARGVHVAGLALDAARALAGARAADPRDVAPRRAQRRLLRARAGEGDRAAGRARLHVRHRGGQLRARRDRGARGARAAARAHRRPPARAARRSAPGRRSTRSSSTAAPPSGSSRSTTTRPRPSACAGCASSPAARSGPRSTAAPARCTSTSRCASRSCSTRRCPTRSPAAAGAPAGGRG